MIAWVFLDVGNVLLDEDRLTYRAFRIHVDAIRRARPDRAARAEAGSAWPVFEVAASYLDEAGVAAAWAEAEREIGAHYGELCRPIPGATELLDRLGRRFRLGLIANQPEEARAHLAAL